MDYITSFKSGLGPDYVKTVCFKDHRIYFEVDFYRDIDGNVRTYVKTSGYGMLDVQLLAEVVSHMAEVVQLLEAETVLV